MVCFACTGSGADPDRERSAAGVRQRYGEDKRVDNVRDQKKKKGPEIPETVYQNFEKLFRDQYRYFDYPAMLRKLQLPLDLWNQGMRLAKDKIVELESVDVRFFYNMGGVQSGMARGIIHEKNRSVSISAWFGQDTITEITCYHKDCLITYFNNGGQWHDQICPHMVMRLITAQPVWSGTSEMCMYRCIRGRRGRLKKPVSFRLSRRWILSRM